MSKPESKSKPQGPSVFALLAPYRRIIALMVVLTVITNLFSLVIPKLISRFIDAYVGGDFVLSAAIAWFTSVALFIFVFTYVQSVLQTYASERVARDLRNQLTAKISKQSFAFIQKTTPSKLLTYLTSDIDAIKLFVSQAIVSLASSAIVIVGSAALLLSINWKLALAVLALLPIIGITFSIILAKVRVLFKKSQEVIDWLNKVINESILGSALIRVLNAQRKEGGKFIEANTEARDIGMQILKNFSLLIPVISLVASLATLVILVLGGKFVIDGSMSFGDFAAFNSYVALMIFPILVIGFMSNVIAGATASYVRILEVLNAPEKEEIGTVTAELRGDIALKGVTLAFGEKQALKDVSLEVKAHTKTAVIGPTAAGKTQLLYLLTGLMHPDSGTVEFDGRPVDDYEKTSLHNQVGFVFQESIMFNLTLRENIAFSKDVSDADLAKAIDTAELHDFIATLPNGLDTLVSERGTSLSGGQKQRIMLARSLAINPKVLLLDDFTARVDAITERKILGNIERNYPGITLLSVTQKLAAVEHYDQIVLLMEGEILAKGKHDELMKSSPEYVQIVNSQRSTNTYELQPE